MLTCKSTFTTYQVLFAVISSVKSFETTVLSDYIQLFRQRLSHKSVKAYATMPIGIMGSLVLLDCISR